MSGRHSFSKPHDCAGYPVYKRANVNRRSSHAVNCSIKRNLAHALLCTYNAHYYVGQKQKQTHMHKSLVCHNIMVEVMKSLHNVFILANSSKRTRALSEQQICSTCWTTRYPTVSRFEYYLLAGLGEHLIKAVSDQARLLYCTMQHQKQL